MNTSRSAHRTGHPLALLSAAMMGAFVLSGCVTDDRYTRQLCLDKGIAAGTSAYSDCVSEQKASIAYWNERFDAYRPNG